MLSRSSLEFQLADVPNPNLSAPKQDMALQGVDWVQVQGHIDCTAELKELVAPGGAEDLFRTNSELNFDMIAEEELLEDEEIMTPDLTLHSNVTSPTAYAPLSILAVFTFLKVIRDGHDTR